MTKREKERQALAILTELVSWYTTIDGPANRPFVAASEKPWYGAPNTEIIESKWMKAREIVK